MQKKIITIVACYFGPKLGVGVFIEKLLLVLIPSLKSNGYQVNLIANQNVLNNSPALEFDNVKIVKFKELERSSTSKIFFLTKFGKTEYVRDAKYVFFLADSVIGYGVENAVSIVHDINEFEITSKFGYIRTWFRKKMIKRVLSRAQKVIVISDFVLNQIYKYFPSMKYDTRFSVVHNGIDIKNIVVENNLLDNVDRNYFLIVGRVDPLGKKLYEALKIYKVYKEIHPEYKLKIVGGMNDFCRKDGMQFIRYAQTIDGVEYLGYVEEDMLNRLYSNATATIFYSQFEGFGFPILEAFLRGCPVITNKANEVNDELAKGFDLKIDETELEDKDLISSKIDRLSQISKTELIAIAKQFSWESTAQKYLNILMN